MGGWKLSITGIEEKKLEEMINNNFPASLLTVSSQMF